MSKLNSSCPLEKMVEEALIKKGIKYFTESEKENEYRLDFFLPDIDIYVEVKGGHSERINSQMARRPNIILIQGVKSAKFFCKLLDNAASE